MLVLRDDVAPKPAMSGGRLWIEAAWTGSHLLRAVALDVRGVGDAARVFGVARVDVTVDADFGCWTDDVPIEFGGRAAPTTMPLSGVDLIDAITSPPIPTAILVAEEGAATILSPALVGELPVAPVLKAVERLWETIPSDWLRMGWLRGGDRPDGAPTPLTREALLIAELALILLGTHSPECILERAAIRS